MAIGGAAQIRPLRRHIDGVVLVDKPKGLTSNATLQRVKRAYGAQKAGHTGTLDPLATGLLPICFGEATKFSAGLLDADKSYRTTLYLGITTETGDAEGAIVAEQPPTVERARIEQALVGFRGEILQVPHRYSALKRGGRALYEYARAGETVSIAPRPIRIYALEVEHWESPLLNLLVTCSKGTYVRSLAEDIGAVLGCGAHVAELRRTRVGPFDVAQATTLAALESFSETERDAALLPITSLLHGLPVLRLRSVIAARFCQGQRVNADGVMPVQPGELVAVYGPATESGLDNFLGLGRAGLVHGEWQLVPARLVVSPRTIR